MSENSFYAFLDEYLKNIQHIVCLTSVIIHERYKYKYSCKSYEEQIWINNLDNSISSKQVKESLLNDIKKLANELLLYNETRQNKYINIIAGKLQNIVFMKSVMRELIELFYIE
jgi:hypothetical protein